MSNIFEYIRENKRDAILYKSEQWLYEAGDDPFDKSEALKHIARLVCLIKDPTLRNSYIESIATGKAPNRIKLKLFSDIVQRHLDAISVVEEEDDEESKFDKLPSYMSKEDIVNKGFATVVTDKIVGYYGWSGSAKTEISNFIIKPLFHVRGNGVQSRHIFEVKNNIATATLDVQSKALVSTEVLQSELVSKGNFLFFGSKIQLLKISHDLLNQFPMCDELKTLGWQPEGFWSYVDRYYVPKPFDVKADDDTNYGLHEIPSGGVFEVRKKHFLVPAASSVFQDMREDMFEAQRVLSYQEPEVTFEVWTKKIHAVYGEDGLVGIAYVLCTLFRDIVFAVDHNFPHLYAHGERSSGKSKWAESLTAFFYKGRAAFNLNSGTEYAFFGYLNSFCNGLAHLNEFDDKVVKDEWFQAIKGFFDGEGRQRGKMGSRVAVETQKAESGIILTGQYLSTKDDNSIVTRSIIRAFHEKQFTDEEKANYSELKQWESKGLSGLITDVLRYRSEVKASYYDQFNDMLGRWRRSTPGEFNSRVFQNWCHLATIWDILSKYLPLPVPTETFNTIAYRSARDLSTFVRSSDTLNDFWNTVVFLLDESKITSGWDFRVETMISIKLRSGDGNETLKIFDAPKKLLIIRLDNVHKHYQKSHKERTGKEGMTIDNLKHYFSNRPYYIGQIKQMQFKKYVYGAVEKSAAAGPLTTTPQINVTNEMRPQTTTTSAYVFDYEMLGCELERNVDEMNPTLF